MKKTILNQIVDFKVNLISAQQILSLSIKRVLLILIFFISSVNILAQNSSSVTPTVMDLKAFISSLKTGNEKMQGSVSNSQYVENLIIGIQPAIYFNSGTVKTYGDIPVKLFTDITSLNGISSANMLKDNIEIIVINIVNTTDLYSKIDLLKFSDFNKLKYIFILSNVSTTEQNIANMFLNYNQQYSIFYDIENAQ